MTVRYVVEYGDERGNQQQTIHSDADTAINDALATITLAGLDPNIDPYSVAYPAAGSITHNAHQYVSNCVPWDSIWSIGDGDNPFTVHGYDGERGNWSVSLVMVREA